ncbi:MAG TPA: 30S ribosomal protein S8 [Patescibacteria group bacterium]
MTNSLPTDFLIRIKNGSLSGRKTIDAPVSKLTVAMAELLKKYGYIADFKVEGEVKKNMTINLAYVGIAPVLSEVRIFSKPGRRFYEKSSSIPWGKTPKSLIIISTSAGVMSQKEAVAKKLGGEVIAEVY